MNDQPDPDFDALHPSGAILARSCRGGAAHSVVLGELVMSTDVDSLAEGILLTTSVSHLLAVMPIRAELIAGLPDDGPTSDVPTPQDLDDQRVALSAHVLRTRDR